MSDASEFLVRVRPLPDGGFEATCSQAVVLDTEGASVGGHGSTPLAAMIAALANSQVQDITQTQEGQDV